jgi:hypothetical protein
MTRSNSVAIVFPADPALGSATDVRASRFGPTVTALSHAGLDVVGAPYSDALIEDVRDRLSMVGGVLVWLNPIEAGRDRTRLNALLREIAAKGVLVSTHPDVIDRMGTKEVLYKTRHMGWGCETKLYQSADAMLTGLRESMAAGEVRVLKQIRGHSGDGIYRVAAAERATGTNDMLLVRHAKRGSPQELMSLDAFLAHCAPYFAATGAMIDQPYQHRLTDGMIRCYVVGDRVAGFGEQLINALYPAADGAPVSAAPQPGPRLYYPPTRADFQRLKQILEREWLPELCATVGVERSQLPVLWDADFLFGPKDAQGNDTYVLCEINVSSVYPYPDDARAPLVAETVSRLKRTVRE